MERVKKENFPKAFVEVKEILNNMKDEDIKQIPESFIEIIEKNCAQNYNFKIDYSKKLDEQYILRETKIILAYIFLNYWSTQEQKIKIEQKLKNDIIRADEEKKKKYQVDVFKNENQVIVNETIENKQLVEYKKINLIQKIIDKIKRILKK